MNASAARSRRAQAVLEAVIAMTSDLDIHNALERIVRSACEVTEARYGALGVLAQDGHLQEFVTHGIDPETMGAIGDLPHGRGILGLVIRDPRPLRLEDLSSHPASYGFPSHHPPMKTFLGVPIRVHGEIFGNLYLTEKRDGSPFTKEDTESVLALAGAAGHVIENVRAYQLSERRRQWLEATGRIADSLQPPVELHEALHEIGHTLRAVSGARAVAVMHLNDASRLHLDTVDGPDAAGLRRLVAEHERRLLDLAGAGGTMSVGGGSARWWVVVTPLTPALAAPRVLVRAFDSPERVEDPDEQRLLQSFVDHAALALDRAQALVDREELAVLSERDRIARDLHDVIIQRLFATGMQLQGLQLQEDPDAVREGLSKAVDDIDVTIKNIRSTIFDLRTSAAGTLRSEVARIVREYVPLIGFRPELRTVGPVDTVTPAAVQRELLAVLREALSNIVKHASAAHVSVEVEVDERCVTLRVQDDGVGLSAERHESGLRNARRRATSLNGSFELTRASPRGTRLQWQVPI